MKTEERSLSTQPHKNAYTICRGFGFRGGGKIKTTYGFLHCCQASERACTHDPIYTIKFTANKYFFYGRCCQVRAGSITKPIIRIIIHTETQKPSQYNHLPSLIVVLGHKNKNRIKRCISTFLGCSGLHTANGPKYCETRFIWPFVGIICILLSINNV